MGGKTRLTTSLNQDNLYNYQEPEGRRRHEDAVPNQRMSINEASFGVAEGFAEAVSTSNWKSAEHQRTTRSNQRFEIACILHTQDKNDQRCKLNSSFQVLAFARPGKASLFQDCKSEDVIIYE